MCWALGLGSTWTFLGAQRLGLALSLAPPGHELGLTHKNLWSPAASHPSQVYPHLVHGPSGLGERKVLALWKARGTCASPSFPSSHMALRMRSTVSSST